MTAPQAAASVNTVIESLGVYLPERSVSTTDILNGCKRRILFPLEHVTGIRSRRIAADGEFAIDLARHAVERCLSMSKYGPEDVDLLICCNISRYDGASQIWFEPSTALRLRHEFGFTHALAMDVSNACAGLFTGVAIVESFLRAGAIRRGMVVSGELITHLTVTAQRELKGFTDPRLACLTLGDSGVSAILEPGADEVAGLHAIDIYTLGRYADYCVGKASDKAGGGAIMLTDVIRLSTVAIEQATTHAVSVQSKAGWPPELMSQLIMHQTSERTIQLALGRVNRLYGKRICSDSNVVFNLAERGNTATTSHFVAFYDKVLDGSIQAGDNIVFSINASGLTIGTAVYKCDDLPERIRAHHSNGHTAPKATAAAPPQPRRSVRAETPVVRIESIGVLEVDVPVRQDTVEMSAAAAEACLERSRYDRREIDLLIYGGVYRTDHICEPALASMVAGKLALNHTVDPARPERTFCFDVMSGATGALTACQVASEAIRSGRHRRALIVASEIEHDAHGSKRSHMGLRQAASAMILDRSSRTGEGFGEFTFKYFTEHVEAFRSYVDLTVARGELIVHKAPGIEELYVDAIAATVHEHLDCRGVPESRITMVFAPQISPTFLKSLAPRIGVTCPVVDVATEGADLYTSSVPYALAHVRHKGLVEPGDVGLVVSVATGIQVGCVLYYF